MNFDISEEQTLLQETIQQYAENECPPTRIRELFETREGWEPPFWKGLVEMGLGGLIVPEEFGGAGLEVLDLALAQEALAYSGAPGPFLGHSLCCLAIAAAGSDEQKQRFLPKILSGEEVWCQGYSEPNAGSDLASLRASAEDAGDHFVVNGQKTWTTYAQYADWIFCLVRTDPNVKKQSGITFLLIDNTIAIIVLLITYFGCAGKDTRIRIIAIKGVVHDLLWIRRTIENLGFRITITVLIQIEIIALYNSVINCTITIIVLLIADLKSPWEDTCIRIITICA